MGSLAVTTFEGGFSKDGKKSFVHKTKSDEKIESEETI